jgi:glucose-6-phosphate isomerase
MTALTKSPAWRALAVHYRKTAARHLRDVFTEEKGRFGRFSLRVDDLLLDFSKNRITDETLGLLVDLARQADVEGWRQRMLDGEAINVTEDRAVLHIALRAPEGGAFAGDAAISGEVKKSRAAQREFAEAVRSGRRVGATGELFRDVVHIGIGGSHLGPALMVDALAPWSIGGPKVHFVSNIDGSAIAETLAACHPETTLFLIASKTFTTEETMTNARTARAWLTEAIGNSAVADHFVGLTANPGKAQDFGITEVFAFWNWVGGRMSVWSACGLPVALAAGPDMFDEFLAGGHAMDRHFSEAPLDQNIPVILALLGVWYRGFFGCQGHAVLPYDQHLALLPAYLQQLDMESNGKSVNRSGEPVGTGTAPLVFGVPGTDGQHAFYQLLHQGPDMVPTDFLAAAENPFAADGHHDLLIANCLAQTAALMLGRDSGEVRRRLIESGIDDTIAETLAPHRTFPGNRPSNTLLARVFDARTLGMLIALYEHKIFVQGVIWDINSFDQWGVELGKELARAVAACLAGETGGEGQDASTEGLIAAIREMTSAVS